MRVDDDCLAFLKKGACRIEAGDYDRNLQRQAGATSGSMLARLQSASLFPSWGRFSQLPSRGRQTELRTHFDSAKRGPSSKKGLRSVFRRCLQYFVVGKTELPTLRASIWPRARRGSPLAALAATA